MAQAQPASATLTNVSTSTTSATLFSANENASIRTIWNDSAAALYVKWGTTASATSCTVKIAADGFYEFPRPIFTGRVDGVLASGTGTARVTEV